MAGGVFNSSLSSTWGTLCSTSVSFDNIISGTPVASLLHLQPFRVEKIGQPSTCRRLDPKASCEDVTLEPSHSRAVVSFDQRKEGSSVLCQACTPDYTGAVDR